MAGDDVAFLLDKDGTMLRPDGATYHLEIRAGDVFPRILTVGSKQRAKAIAALLDAEKPVRVICSERGFHTFSGFFNGVGVSIMAIGMGAAMMDFLIREVTLVQPGPLAIVRLGTCGLITNTTDSAASTGRLPAGTVVTAGKGSLYIYKNYAHFSGCLNAPSLGGADSPPFLVAATVPCTPELNRAVAQNLKAAGVRTYDGLNASGETFYAAQSRTNPQSFRDENGKIPQILKDNRVDSIDMETHQLFHLAAIRTGPTYVAAAAIGLVGYSTSTGSEDKVISLDTLRKTELTAGSACLKALAEFSLP